MKSSRVHARSYTSNKIEQIIAEFFTKSLQIILESRCSDLSSPSSSSSSSSCSSSFETRDKWFNLALKEYPQTLVHIDSFHHGNTVSMVIDILIVCESLKFENRSSNGRFYNTIGFEREENGRDLRSENVIERWLVQYDNQESKECSGNVHTLYKKLIVLMRSLYTTVRLLPAYNLCRNLLSLNQTHSYRISYRVSSFAEPFTRKEEANMHEFSFTPVETSRGRLCVSVSYNSSMCNVIAEPSVPISPWFIPDYVGTQPLKESMYLDSHALISKCRSYFSPPVKFKGTNTKSTDLNELRSFPVFFPIHFPSSSICVARMDASKALLRHESAPVGTPASKGFNKKTMPISSKSDSEEFIDASASLLAKMSFCRRFRRFQIGDGFDNAVFTCPFAGDDDNMIDSISRLESYHKAAGLGTRPNSQSKDATIGALILMLKKAPPLAHLKLDRQQSEKSTGSGMVSSKTLTNGLEELQEYVRIKEMLLSHTHGSKFNLV